MFPVICKIGPASIYSYGLMLAVAVVVCSFLLGKDAKRQGLSAEMGFDLIFFVTVFGILGARVFYIFLYGEYFLANPAEMIMIQRGGLAWQGGLVGGFIAALLFIRKRKLSILTILDLGAPYIALGQSIGRVGCFLNGCCYGKPLTNGIYFPVHDAHLHPTQLYSSLGLLIIFFALRRYQRHAKYPGQVFIFYLILACLLRFGVEFFRGDHVPYYGFTLYQYISVIIMMAAIYVNTRIKGQNRK